MYGLIGKMTATEGKREELLSALLEGTGNMPGCHSYIVARDPADANALWITEVWESKEHHAASLKLAAVQKAIAAARPWIAGFSNRVETEPVGGHGLLAAPDPFAGTWVLDPASLRYESGKPGRRALYVITGVGGGLMFTLDGEDGEGRPVRFEYGGPLDGAARPLPGNEKLSLVLRRDGPRTVTSELQSNGRTLDRWTRELSADGQAITMTQYVPKPGGGEFRNLSVYRRVR